MVDALKLSCIINSLPHLLASVNAKYGIHVRQTCALYFFSKSLHICVL